MDILFEEIQQFDRGRGRHFLKILTGILLALTFFSFFWKSEQRDEVTISLLTATLICLLLSLILTRWQLITQVRADGIYVKYPPLQPGFTRIPWNEIDELFVRKYFPIGEFGGWGIRISPNGRAYNLSGDVGLQIIFKDGRRLLIGTHQPEALARILNKLNKLTPK